MKNLIISFLMLFVTTAQYAQSENWQTDYEKSGMVATPTYAQTMSFLDRLDTASAEISTADFGISPQGRPLRYLIYDVDGLKTAEQLKASGRVLLMVQAGIHPGESEGKDALLMLLRDQVLEGKYDALFEKVSLLFVPIFNVDGHERFSPYGRINQNGPIEMGWRTTAQNLNLNRDYLKAEAPEMQAWLSLFNRFDPHFFIDTHTSDGADYQYVMTYAMETAGNMEAGLTAWQAEVFLPFWKQQMNQSGFPVFPYVSFRKWHDPRSGLVSWISGPMLSQGYTAQRNRPGLLLETHMLKPYNQRVEATKASVVHAMELLAQKASELQELLKAADEYTASGSFREQDFALDFQIDMTDSTLVAFDGVAYKVTKSDLTGGDWFVYDNQKPQQFVLPFFDKAKVLKTVKLPEAYIVPVEWINIIGKLKSHGVHMKTLEADKEMLVETYLFTDISWQTRPYEGRHRVNQMSFEPKMTNKVFPAGSVIVPMNQPLARLIAYMLEPEADGSLLEWGFFDAVFEQKEYAESYVMEPLARRMLDSIPGLREAYQQKKQSDKNFANSSWAQLNWFYKQTPWWDQQFMVYPIGRLMQWEE
ncbi:MAG: M14 family metallopeptidase [Bacteroidetes bacterium]|nr:M14 family metallopeptidase [Bacteroidota bacterium]MBU1579031.1 M14 family metallopeptidase [Bacteroidota bacterium]MBU2465770.1 M14 family metallopeptidase [Bacteroidota bacterium]MBU2558368.1 M14 family metallopeptidase [Bacteroidota bacterium]